jgi:hypothetical protein
MKRMFLVVLASLFAVSLVAADAPKECMLCVGAVTDLTAIPATPVPLVARFRLDDLTAAGTALGAMTPAARAKTALVISYSATSLDDIEARTKTIIDWARQHGPFDALGVAVEAADATQTAYAIKRLAVTAQGQNAAAQIVLPQTPVETLNALADAGALPYVDALLVDASNVRASAAWVVEKDPSKKLWAVVAPQSANSFYDLARALADGATRAYLAQMPDAETFAALAAFDKALIGEYAYDATARIETLDAKGNKIDAPAIAFVRGEDLRTIVVPRGDVAAATITSLPGDFYVKPRRVDAAGDREMSDVGQKGGRFLIGVLPVKRPFVFTVEHNEKPRPNVTKDAMEVATQRGITVEEIIRNHQAYDAYQDSIQPRFIAQNTTSLRFSLTGGEAIEASIAGKYFSDPNGRADWVWSDFFINGVRWKYGRIPELPLIQPEKVTQLPLDIHLTNEYRYQLVRETELDGYRVYEVRFEPPPNAPANLPLYRGTVWIDKGTWARIRIAMVQLNLTGNILSNEERVDFAPFARATHAPLAQADVAKTEAKEIVWLPVEVGAQQIVSAAGRANVVLRSTKFTGIKIEPEDFEQTLAEASASDARMVRETTAGMRYLEKSGSGERVVKEGFETSRKFLVGGVHHDAGLEFPVVPLGGIDYFNFDWAKRGIQTNVFFAGVVLSANATHPNVANTRTNVGADLFAIAIPTTNSMHRDGIEREDEAVKQLPTWLSLRAGHPFATFGKIDVSLGLGHIFYKRGDDADPSFQPPSSTFLVSPSVSVNYARWGYTAAMWYDFTQRTTWKPWGVLSEYDPSQKSFSTYGASLAKSFYLPKFQRIGLEVDYLDGQRLDRFSKYELGFFGARRIHGIRSGTVRAERAILGHLTYGFVFSDQFRMEAFYDHGLIDDTLAGYRREPFQGVGIAGQTVGPYGTLLRLDIGKTIGRNAQDGFVANVVFLKLF